MDESNYNIQEFMWGRRLTLKENRTMRDTVTIQKDLNSLRKWEQRGGVKSFVEVNGEDTYHVSYIMNTRRLLISKNTILVKRFDHINFDEANVEIKKLSVTVQVLDITPIK